jgi:hypothetical protein
MPGNVIQKQMLYRYIFWISYEGLKIRDARDIRLILKPVTGYPVRPVTGYTARFWLVDDFYIFGEISNKFK